MPRQFRRFATLRLAAHALDRSGMLIAIAIPAFVLSFLIRAGEFLGAPKLLLRILTIVEYAILITDAFLVICCLIKDAWLVLREK